MLVGERFVDNLAQRLAKIINQRKFLSNVSKLLTVLGIETSCDDTAVSVLSSDGNVLSTRNYANREAQARIGGICPYVSAAQHRKLIDKFVDECLVDCGKRLCDLDGVAVTTRPGLAIALAVGAEKAVRLSRKGHIPLIKVHHMQAHATVASLFHAAIKYPFVAVLISGGHSLIALVIGANQFKILIEANSSSPGECFDKIARQLPINDYYLKNFSGGAIIEQLAANSSHDGYSKYLINMPRSKDANFNFSSITNSYLQLLSKMKLDIDIKDFCAGVQFTVAAYLAKKLHHCMEFLYESDEIKTISKTEFIVLSGGVASNGYIRNALEKVATFYGHSLIVPPLHLCCDNAEMIAWNGIKLLQENSSEVISPDSVPFSVWVDARSPVGENIGCFPKRPRKHLSLKSITSERLLFHFRRTT